MNPEDVQIVTPTIASVPPAAVTSTAPATPGAAATPHTTTATSGGGGGVPPPQTVSVANAPPPPVFPDAVVTLPTIGNEPPDGIYVGTGGILEVPREDLDADIDDGTEIDLMSLQAKKIRKPGRREWIILNRTSELTTRLLLHKSRPDAIDTDYYHVHDTLRAPIRDELKVVRVFTYYSLIAKSFALWIANVTVDNPWYESLAQLFRHPPAFFSQNAVRVSSDKNQQCYRVRAKPVTNTIVWPTKSTGELLAEALGAEHFINSVEHPIYRDLTDGVEL